MTELEQNKLTDGEETINKNIPDCVGLPENDINLSENTKEIHVLSLNTQSDSETNKIEEDSSRSLVQDLTLSSSFSGDDIFQQESDRNTFLTNNEIKERENHANPSNSSHTSQ